MSQQNDTRQAKSRVLSSRALPTIPLLFLYRSLEGEEREREKKDYPLGYFEVSFDERASTRRSFREMVTRKVFSYASVESTHRPLTVTFTWPFDEREKARKRSEPSAPGARYRSQVHASGQLRPLVRWMFDAINSTDINRDRDRGVGERGDGRARNDSRWLSGGVPEPAYLLTLSSRVHPCAETRTRPITGNTSVPWGRFDRFASYR